MSETELALVPRESALQVFSTPEGLDPYLAKIKAEIDAFVPNIKTATGRKDIASIAHKVARSKTALDNIGKELVAELKDVPKKIDAERKRMRDLLDAWKDEVRKPLTEWEQAEEERQAKHRWNVDWFADQVEYAKEGDADKLRAVLADIDAKTVDDSWEEFESEAHRAKARALDSLTAALVAREKYEAEQAELARLRAEAAAREQREREERIAREAAYRAQCEAEEKARAEREAAIRREQEAKAAAERRELELKLAAEQAEKEKLAAQQREEQARRDAEARAQQAAAAERQRIADEQATADADAKRREADKAHRQRINRAAMDALVAGGVPESCARQALTLIVQHKVPNVSITY